LAHIYGYELKAMNQQVKRNIERFPEDFMFQLKQEEIPGDYLRSQFVTLYDDGTKGKNVLNKYFSVGLQVKMLEKTMRN
jgi:hypothetical protein